MYPPECVGDSFAGLARQEGGAPWEWNGVGVGGGEVKGGPKAGHWSNTSQAKTPMLMLEFENFHYGIF